MTIEQAKELRKLLEFATISLTDEQVLECHSFVQKWGNEISYVVGDRVNYNDILYKCLTPHVSQETWIPTDSPSLWARVLTSETEILEWIQPDSTNAYMTGDRVLHNGLTYESEIDNNVWEPGVYGWTLI